MDPRRISSKLLFVLVSTLFLHSLVNSQSITLPRDATPGHIITILKDNDLHSANLKAQIYSELFEVTTDGVVYTKQRLNIKPDINSFNIGIEYRNENGESLSTDLKVELTDVRAKGFLQSAYNGFICLGNEGEAVVKGLETLLKDLHNLPVNADVVFVKGDWQLFDYITQETSSEEKIQISKNEETSENKSYFWSVLQVNPYEEYVLINVSEQYCVNKPSNIISKPLVHHTDQRMSQRATREDKVFVVNSLSEGDLFTVGTIPEVIEEEFTFSNPEPGILQLNAVTGMISLAAEQSLLGVDSITFTVVISRTDNATYEDLQNVSMIVVNRTYEDPIFENTPYPIQALTTMWIRPGTPILQLQAIDATAGMEVVYQLQSGGNGRFTIDSVTGEILIVGRQPFSCSTLDEPYYLAISAQGLGVPESTTTPAQNVTVYCDDINPQFYGYPYTLDIDEATPIGDVLISLAAKSFYDLPIEYTLQVLEYTPGWNVTENIYFDINATTGDLIASKVLDYTVDPHRYVVMVTATEAVSGYTTTQQMILFLVDINNHMPTFPPVVYPATVPETINSSEAIIEVFVVDDDTGPAGDITFLPDNPYFVVDKTGPKSATIRLSDIYEGVLDYESLVEKYVEFTLTATDNGVPPLSGTVVVRVTVENENDNDPVMSPDSPQTAYMKETAVPGTLVHVIQAYDPDGETLEFAFTGSPNNSTTQWDEFILDQTSGHITLASQVDANDWDGTSMNVIVSDGARQFVGVIEVQRIGVNRPPSFPNCSDYAPLVEEHSEAGTFVITVTAADQDIGLFGRFSYSIGNDGRDYFDINSETGEVTTIADPNDIDRENPPDEAIVVSGEVKYPITVVATDLGTPSLAATCFFLVTVSDIDDNPPIFDATTTDPYHTAIDPGVNVSENIFRVFAYDVDATSAITYSLNSPACGGCFDIDPNTGWITVKNKDNFPTEADHQISVTVYATDGENDEISTPMSILFTTSLAEQPPKWQPVIGTDEDIDLYILNISDDTARDTVLENIYQATANDASGIVYAMPEGPLLPLNKDRTFIDVETDSTMKIEVNGDLDFALQSDYVVRLRATKSGGSIYSDARLQINIHDSNDKDPEFIGLDVTDQYPAAVAEDINPIDQQNYFILTVFAIDRDGQAPNNEITYIIDSESGSCGNNDMFVIDKIKGDITISDSFDAIGQSQLFLCVRAIDGPGRESSVQQIYVDVIPSSPSPPEFTQSLYNYSIASNAERGTIVARIAVENTESLVHYQITGGNEMGIFNTNPLTGEIFTVLDVWMADTLEFTLIYRVFDGQEFDITTVVINVEAVNLFPPCFNQSDYTYRGIIEQNYSSPVLVAVPYIEDPDTDSGQNIYAQLAGTLYDSNSFNINPDTFEVTVTSSLDRDYPMGHRTWQINIVADDLCNQAQCESTSRRGYALVNVELEDINDNYPLFDASLVNGTVVENTDSGTPVMTVNATDFDAGENARVFYRLINDSGGRFVIVSTSGLISTTSIQLDREVQDTYTIVVQAFNPSDPSRSSTQTMTILVDDANDNPPYFSQTSFTATIAEGGEYGSFVTDIPAYDIDIGQNAFRFFDIEQPPTDYFYVDSILSAGTASIKIQNPIDYEKMDNKTLTFTLNVRNHNDTYPQSNTTVIVKVTDISDSPPVVNPSAQSADISEGVLVGSIIATFQATDDDEDNTQQFNFSIDYESSDPYKWFDVDVISGQVVVRNEIDRELLDEPYQIEVKVLAIDVGIPPQTGTGTLTINILDVNDNIPYFNSSYNFRVGAETVQGDEVGTVYVTDPDSSGSSLTISIDAASSGQAMDDFEFQIDEILGTVTVVALRSDGYTRSVLNLKQYEVYVNLADSEGARRETFYITVESVNENPHTPGQKDIMVFNYMRSLPLTALGNVYAEDEDDWDRYEKTFTFATEYEFFNLSEVGELYLIPGARYGVHNLQINVADDTTEVTSSATVNIVYLDDDAMENVASMRIAGTTVEDLLTRTKVAGSEVEYNNNDLTVFKQTLAPLLGLTEENIWIISVRQVPVNTDHYKWQLQPNMVDVYYVAYTGVANYNGEGITWFRPASLNGIVWTNREILQQMLGDNVTILMSPINNCLYTNCWSEGCTNQLLTTTNGLIANTNTSSIVGVDVQFKASCTCGARDLTFEETPETCGVTSCLNGGTCYQPDIWENIYCICPQGFEGLRCEQYKVSLDGTGWAWYSPIQSCELDIIGVEFLTTTDTGLLLYNGPMESPTGSNLPMDYIFLEIVSGIPVLGINLGNEDLFLEMKQTSVTLNDGRWHQLQIFKNGLEVSLVVDACRNAIVDENLKNSSVDLTSCKVSSTLRNEFLLDTMTPLEIGGRSHPNINYPPNINGQGFDGCIKNLRINGELYDLHIESVGASQGATNDCPQEEASCAVCPTNSTCVGSITGESSCICDPGVYDEGCSQQGFRPVTSPSRTKRQTFFAEETTVRSLPTANSFIQWDVTNSYNASVNNASNQLQLLFRTRQENSIIFMASSFSTLERIILEITNSYLQFRYDLGSGDETVSLPYTNASDGRWHKVLVTRFGNQVSLHMDYGTGRYFNQSEFSSNSFQQMNLQGMLFVGGNVFYPRFQTVPTITDPLTDSCVNDVRFSGAQLPMVAGATSTVAALASISDTTINCTSQTCSNDTCVDEILVPEDRWRLCVCTCPLGQTEADPPLVCAPVLDCSVDQCVNGVCIDDADGNFICYCDEGFSGTRCDIGGFLYASSSAELSLEGLLIIIGSIIILLLLLLFLVIARLLKKEPDTLLEAVEAVDTNRENIVFYEEEGAGEEDERIYDISGLQIPVEIISDSDSSRSTANLLPHNSDIKRTEVKPVTGYDPSDRQPVVTATGTLPPNIGTFIGERLSDADYDFNVPPWDSVREYEREGSIGGATDLSSLASSSDSNEHFDYLNDWGPRFRKLAQMYGAESSTDSDRESSIDIPVKATPFSTYERPPSPDSETNSEEFRPIGSPSDYPDTPRYARDPPAYVNPIPPPHVPKDVHTSSDDSDYYDTVIPRQPVSRSPSPQQLERRPYQNDPNHGTPGPSTPDSELQQDPHHYEEFDPPNSYLPQPGEPNNDEGPYANTSPREGEPSEDESPDVPPRRRSSSSSSSSSRSSQTYVSNDQSSVPGNDPHPQDNLYEDFPVYRSSGMDNLAYVHPEGDSPSSLESEV